MSAEVENNRFTGRGEIGSFPSPDYANKRGLICTDGGCDYECDLIEEYQPFQNYGGDDNIVINSLIKIVFLKT